MGINVRYCAADAFGNVRARRFYPAGVAVKIALRLNVART